MKFNKSAGLLEGSLYNEFVEVGIAHKLVIDTDEEIFEIITAASAVRCVVI